MENKLFIIILLYFILYVDSGKMGGVRFELITTNDTHKIYIYTLLQLDYYYYFYLNHWVIT